MTTSSDLLLPLDVPEAQAIIRRLCKLQEAVAGALDPSHDRAADCFCGEGGFWPFPCAGPTSYKNELHAIEFIERATHEALERLQGSPE